MPQLEQHACAEYLDGFSRIGLQQDQLPNLSEVTKRLQAAHGVELDARERVSAGGCIFRDAGCADVSDDDMDSQS